LLYTATDQDITFLVPDSCRATIRNGNSISGDVSENIIKKLLERRLFMLFLHNLDIILDFLTLRDKQNIRTMSENVKFICNRCQTGQKTSSSIRCSKAHTNKLNIFRQCMYIVYILDSFEIN
jgi:hypothetical protein